VEERVLRSPKTGENFTNSIGIELVWVPEGRFWISRSEVTEKQYHTVIPSGLQGAEKSIEAVSITQAKLFCQKLTEREIKPAEPQKTESASSVPLKPEDGSYALPSISQWQAAKATSKALQLKGMDDNLHEWTSNVHGDGLSRVFPQSPFILKRIDKHYPVAIDSAGPITLEPTTTKTVKLGITASVWSGRLGFRVILIPRER
jgi:hypothetical protein